MPNPLAHSTDMITTIRPNKMPAFWWVCPWAYARTLHISANAVKAYADRLEDMLDLKSRTIAKQAADIKLLQARVRDQDDAIIKGTAITPDAYPHE
jgi:hypothetical protein